MLIEEQIKIARLIASGTPREVAIQEQFRGKLDPNTDVSDAIETKVTKKKIKPEKQQKTGGKVVDKPNPQQIAKERSAIQKEKQDKIKNNLANIKKKKKDLKADKKLENLRRKSQVIRGKVADSISKANFSSINTQAIGKDEGGATATQKAVGNVAKTGVAATKNVVKGLAKAVVGARNLKRGYQDRKLDKKLYDLEMKKIE